MTNQAFLEEATRRCITPELIQVFADHPGAYPCQAIVDRIREEYHNLVMYEPPEDFAINVNAIFQHTTQIVMASQK